MTVETVEQFLYREARLLDSRRFHEWLDLLTDDVRYRVRTSSNRYPSSSKAISIQSGSRSDDAGAGPDELPLMDEIKQSITQRIARLDTGMAWAEDPPPRTCHVVSNVEVFPRDSDAEVTAYSNLVLYRSRIETEQDMFVGRREDVLRRIDGEWRLASRDVLLAHNVLLVKNVTSLF